VRRIAGVHATFLADAIVEWLHGSVDERTAMANYHERRNAHGLPRITRPCAAPPTCARYRRIRARTAVASAWYWGARRPAVVSGGRGTTSGSWTISVGLNWSRVRSSSTPLANRFQ
jgi:hypothetical protein